MTGRNLLLAFALSALPACASSISLAPVASPLPAERALAYDAATRLVRLNDGSDFLFIPRESPNERVSIEALLVSARGREQDRTFRVSRWIPDLVGEGTIGQIYSAALSPDGNWLAATAGWWGRDSRGHNGVFLMQRATRNGYDFFDLKNWFDVRGLTIGDIEFGPDDTLLTISQENRSGQASPIVTLFSFAGQNLGSFIPSAGHGDARSASFARLMRLSRTGESSFVIYDPEAGAARWVRISMVTGGANVVQEKQISIPVDRPRIAVLAFAALPGGRLVLVHNAVENQHPRTVISLYGPDGKEIENWQPPQLWTYSSSEGLNLHGYSLSRSADAVTHTMVSLR